MLKFGIIGPGKISHRFIKGMQDVVGAKIIACASRDLERATSVKEQYGLEYAYNSYEEMLQNPEIDAVYIATPPHTHKELIMLSLKHGKHVMSEKPFMGKSSDAKECFNYAKQQGCILMEANKGPFTPIFNQAKAWINEGMIGKVLYVDGSDSYRLEYPDDHWVLLKDEAGGGMFDVGVYPLAFTVCLLDSKVVEKVRMSLDHKGLCDGFEQMLLRFENGAMASVRGGIDVQTENKIMIYGEDGYIESTNFWRSHDIKCVRGEEVIEKHFDFNSEFTFQIQHFVDCIDEGLKESPIMSSSRTIEMIQIIEK